MLGESYLMEAKASFACLRLQLVGKGGSQGSERRIVRKWRRRKAGSHTIDASSVSSFSQSSQTQESVEVGSIIAPQVPMTCIDKDPEGRGGYTHLREHEIDIACIAEPCQEARLSNKQDSDFEQQWK